MYATSCVSACLNVYSRSGNSLASYRNSAACRLRQRAAQSRLLQLGYRFQQPKRHVVADHCSNLQQPLVLSG